MQEDSNVIQNIQCSTTAAAPVTAGPTTTTTVTTTECSGFFTCANAMPMPMPSQSPVDDSTGGMVTSDSGMVTTTGATEVTTIISENPSDSTNNDIPPTQSTTTPTATTPVATLPATTTPAATTPVVTTPIVTTPVATTPATTTPVPTTLAVSEQQRAACLVAIEADGNRKINTIIFNNNFSTKRSHLRRISQSQYLPSRA